MTSLMPNKYQNGAAGNMESNIRTARDVFLNILANFSFVSDSYHWFYICRRRA